MGKKLYVGNLPFSATDQILSDTFAQCGTVDSAKIIMDRETGRSKGFGFVEMSSDAEAQMVITKFNGMDYDGRAMTINEARPMAPRENRGGGFGGGNRERGAFSVGRGNRY
jgi:RNA recognition motif-containing protein